MKVTSFKFIATPEQGEVSALLVRPENATALLVLAHGAGTNMEHRSMEQLSEGLAERRIATFRYNFPYKETPGGSGPNRPEVLTATVRTAVSAATEAASDLPLFAGGRSMGGRMSSLAASEEPLPNVKGIVFFAFPLHPPGKPATSRAEHLFKVTVPMLFLQRTARRTGHTGIARADHQEARQAGNLAYRRRSRSQLQGPKALRSHGSGSAR